MRKVLFSLVLVLIVSCHCYSQCSSGIFISEFHYDNIGTDANERIEITAPVGTNLSDYSLVLYNGNNSAAAVVYNTRALSGTIVDQGGGKGTAVFTYPVDGIQNGPNDGFALVNTVTNTVIEFLSYEGVLTASAGPANGQTSTDVGVSENGTTTTVDGSIQRLTCTSWTANPTSNNFGTLPPSPLPITLISFKASLNSSNQAVLKWATASEKDNHYFEIERSKNAIDFESLGKINGKGTSDLRNDYAFTDETPLKGINYYRLKQVDFDGTFSYTRPESVITEGDGSISLYPNPTVNVLKINFEDLDQIETATIYNQSGVMMKNLQGSKSSIDIQELPQGKYILQIRLADQRIITNSFVKF
jgi:hypothetical protein